MPEPRLDYREVRRLYRKGMTDDEISNQIGCASNTVAQWRLGLGLRFNSYSPTHATPALPYSAVDNAVTAAFREVYGFCPFRDGTRWGAGTAIPKAPVRYNELLGVTSWEADHA